MQQFKTPELDRYLCEENHGVRSEYGSTITYTFDQTNAKFVRSTQIDEALEAFRKSNRGYMLVDAGYMCTQDKTILMLTKWKMLGCDE